jgi:hypothetical protein
VSTLPHSLVQASDEQTLILQSTIYPGLSQRVLDVFQERESDQDIYLD